MSRLACVEAAVKATAAEQGGRFAQAGEVLASFTERKAADVQRLGEQVYRPRKRLMKSTISRCQIKLKCMMNLVDLSGQPLENGASLVSQ